MSKNVKCPNCKMIVAIKEKRYTQKELDETINSLQNLIRDMLLDIPVIPDRYKYVARLQEISK